MNRKLQLLVLLIAVIASSIASAQPNTWTQKANFGGTGRWGAVGFSIGTKGYIGTGLVVNFLVNDFWEYDPTANAWTQKANFGGTPRYGAVGFSIGTKGYVGTGLSSGFTNDFWEYDPAANTWTQKANFGGAVRHFAVGFSIGNKGYIGTGYEGITQTLTNDFWEFDPTANTWAQKANFGGTARLYAAGFSIGTKGYIGTGYDNNYLNDFWEYDPGANIWAQKANFGGTVRGFAVGFSTGNNGYIGTGSDGNFSPPKNDLWEYDPTADMWSQRANFGGTGRAGAVGFYVGTKCYIGTGGDNSSTNDFWEYDPTDCQGVIGGNDLPMTWYPDTDGDGYGDQVTGVVTCNPLFGWVNNNLDNCPNIFGLMGYPCDDNNPNTFNDVIDANCICNGSPCVGNQVTLTLNTDANASQTSWDIATSVTNSVVCSGGGYANNSTIYVNCCLANGCYDLRVYDSFGDGINPGGYVLRDANTNRIIDDFGNGPNFTTLSEVRDVTNTPVSFCVPLGYDAMVPTSCDQIGLTINSVIQCQINAAVTWQYNITNTTSGYQFWIFNPNIGFSRRLFQSHAAPGTGYPPLTPLGQRAAYLKLSAMSSAPTIPSNTFLNVRVRSRVANVNLEFGPACRLAIGTPYICSTTQLTTTPTPIISCGATGVNRLTGKIWSNNVTGANRYQFEFVNANTLVFLRNISSPTRDLKMSTWGGVIPLPTPYIPYNIRVRVSFDNGATYCPWGPVCQVTFTFPPADTREMESLANDGVLHVWPNPNNGDQLFISIDDLGEEVGTATIDVIDVFGKRVMNETVAVDGARFNSMIKLKSDLADGLYVVNITAGDRVFTERLIIAK